EVKKILDSQDRIAYPTMAGDWLLNFWQDAKNPRGVWRRTTWESYLSAEPSWETILDIDALAKAENVPWAFGGANCLAPAYRRCLIYLSRGGADATEVREFDLEGKQFISDGFKLPEAKQSLAWVDENTLLVATNFGAGTMSSSGYPLIVKQWRRGAPLSSATQLFRGGTPDMGVFVGDVETADRRYSIVSHRVNFYEGSTHVLQNGKLVKLDLPLDADPNLVGDRMIVYVRTPWQIGGHTWPTGSVISAGLEEFIAGKRDFELVVQPGARETVNGAIATRDYLLVNMLNNVRPELRRYQYQNGSWKYETVPAPALGSIGVVAVSPTSNRYFFTYSSYTQPSTLYLAEENGTIREVRRLPAQFDATGLKVEQLEATSKDGTKIPFFIVQREGAARDGKNPTLLYGYGGFEISMTPNYSGITGTAWLQRGGVYVVANIRGGGEFGPSWHRSALKANRQRAYDDFAAVAEELIKLRVTSPQNLGIMGGSNGGLLMGVSFTQRPDLFNAVVVQVPLLDMQRYNKLLAGASWMAEYGDPDKPEEWAFISKYSPYQNLKPGVKYPKVFFTTTTRDDRVHPGHARKMAAKMESLGYPFYYFENTEGGHGAGVTNEQRAQMYALTYAYLWQQLGRAPVM
ncbi:MAG TPA: prolyl oligopeptidase family serine peptidase, partial [Longimicrobiales bacterium]|nr:prolyl oligopeptidase family serine peptidase [Longimicrobiales bacterium]